jgi:hypothetical protein
MFGELSEEGDAGRRVKLVASHESLQRRRGFAGRYALAQPCGEVRMLAERIELSAQELIEVRLGHARGPNDNSVCGDIPQPLALRAKPARDTADEVKDRQHVDGAQQISRHDLVELETHPFRVHNAEPAQLLPDGLSTPRPFQQNPIADADREVTHRHGGLRDAGPNHLKESQHRAHCGIESDDTKNVD